MPAQKLCCLKIGPETHPECLGGDQTLGLLEELTIAMLKYWSSFTKNGYYSSFSAGISAERVKKIGTKLLYKLCKGKYLMVILNEVGIINFIFCEYTKILLQHRRMYFNQKKN